MVGVSVTIWIRSNLNHHSYSSSPLFLELPSSLCLLLELPSSTSLVLETSSLLLETPSSPYSQSLFREMLPPHHHHLLFLVFDIIIFSSSCCPYQTLLRPTFIVINISLHGLSYHHCSVPFIVIVIIYRYHFASWFWRGLILITHPHNSDGGQNRSLSWWGSNHCSLALHFHFCSNFTTLSFDDDRFRSPTFYFRWGPQPLTFLVGITLVSR